jgi:hypothetical protein
MAAGLFIQLTTPNGHRLDMNPRGISSLRDPIDISSHWAKGTHCIVVMTNGRFNAVGDTCAKVRREIGDVR